jgi:hypothetical protein
VESFKIFLPTDTANAVVIYLSPFALAASLKVQKLNLASGFKQHTKFLPQRKGLVLLNSATRIDVSQKTAWFINHRIRTMLTNVDLEMLEGTVEADETFVGGKIKTVILPKKYPIHKVAPI